MNISLMTIEDLEEVAKIEQESFSMPWSYESLKDAVDNGISRYLVLHTQGEIAGYLGMWYGGDEAEITNVAVAQKFRRKGYGRLLMEGAYAKAKEDGMEKLFLEVRESNEPAKCLYESFGFKNIGIRKNFYEKPVEDAIVMIMRIDGKEGENRC